MEATQKPINMDTQMIYIMDEYSAIKSNGPLINKKQGYISKNYFEQNKPVTKVYKPHDPIYKKI